MKNVQNNPKTYRRREISAPKRRMVVSDEQKKKSLKNFIDGQISAQLYIDLGENPTS